MKQLHLIANTTHNCNNYLNDAIHTFSCLNRVKIFISRRVLWQYVWCSKGEIFFIATFVLITWSNADLLAKQTTRRQFRSSIYLHAPTFVVSISGNVCVTVYSNYDHQSLSAQHSLCTHTHTLYIMIGSCYLLAMCVIWQCTHPITIRHPWSTMQTLNNNMY